jgi:chromosome segregation ATPase
LGGRALVDGDFEARFLQNVTVGGDLTNKTQADTLMLRELFHTGYELELALGNNNKKIDEIVARYKSVVEEYNAVTSRINFLVQTEIPNLTADIEKQKTDRKNAEKALHDVKALLPKLEAQVVQDQATLNAALAKRAPYNAENDRLENILDEAQSALYAADNRLRSILSSIAQSRDRLHHAESELAILRRNLSSYESDVRRSDVELQDARRQRDQFDERGELRRRLERSHEVRRMRSDLQRAEQEEQRFEREAVTAEQNHRAAQRQLAQCQATAGADCSAQQREVDQARAQHEQARSNFEQARRDQERARSNLDREVDQIERQVHEEVRRLDMELAQASERYNRAVRVHDDAVRDMRNLEYNVIPDLQRDLRALDREESLARQDIASLQSQVQRARNDLERYRASVGWNELTEKIRVAQSALSQSTRSRDDALKLKAQQEGIIAYTTRKQNELEGTLLQRNNELISLQAREKQLAASIEKYRQERAPFDLEAQRLQGLIAGARANYKAIVEK